MAKRPRRPRDVNVLAKAMGGRMRVPIGLLLLATFAGAATAQLAATSPSELLVNADRLEGHRITVRGSIANLNEQVSSLGHHSYTFDLGDGQQSIRVFGSGKAPCQAGPATVDGTLQKQKAHQFIIAAKVTCRPRDSN